MNRHMSEATDRFVIMARIADANSQMRARRVSGSSTGSMLAVRPRPRFPGAVILRENNA